MTLLVQKQPKELLRKSVLKVIVLENVCLLLKVKDANEMG